MIKINTDIANLNISINLPKEACTKGGVYMFLIDEIPLYIGETNSFWTRLSDHLSCLFSTEIGLSYFGLDNLVDNHCLSFLILDDNYPYKKIKFFPNKRFSDANKKLRTDLETSLIKKYHPLCQYPVNSILSPELYNKIRKNENLKKIDDILPCETIHNIIENAFNNKTVYSEIQEAIIINYIHPL